MFHRQLAVARKPLRLIRPSSDAVLHSAVHRLIALSIYLLLIALLLLVAPAARADGVVQHVPGEGIGGADTQAITLALTMHC